MNIRDKSLEERQQIIGIYFKGIEEKLYFDSIGKDYESKKRLVTIIEKLGENYSEIDSKLGYHSKYTLGHLTMSNGYKIEVNDSVCISEIYFIYEDNTISESIESIISVDKMITENNSVVKTLCYWKYNTIKIDIETNEIYRYIRNHDRDYVTIVIKIDCDIIY